MAPFSFFQHAWETQVNLSRVIGYEQGFFYLKIDEKKNIYEFKPLACLLNTIFLNCFCLLFSKYQHTSTFLKFLLFPQMPTLNLERGRAN